MVRSQVDDLRTQMVSSEISSQTIFIILPGNRRFERKMANSIKNIFTKYCSNSFFVSSWLVEADVFVLIYRYFCIVLFKTIFRIVIPTEYICYLHPLLTA